MKLQEVVNRYQLGITPIDDERSVIRFCGGEWGLFGDDPFSAFVKQLRDVAWIEYTTGSLKECMSLGNTPEEAEQEWFRREALSRTLLIFFGGEIYDALTSTEEALSMEEGHGSSNS